MRLHDKMISKFMYNFCAITVHFEWMNKTTNKEKTQQPINSQHFEFSSHKQTHTQNWNDKIMENKVHVELYNIMFWTAPDLQDRLRPGSYGSLWVWALCWIYIPSHWLHSIPCWQCDSVNYLTVLQFPCACIYLCEPKMKRYVYQRNIFISGGAWNYDLTNKFI